MRGQSATGEKPKRRARHDQMEVADLLADRAIALRHSNPVPGLGIDLDIHLEAYSPAVA